MTPQESTALRPTTPSISDVHVYDTLGSAKRLWVRGRLILPLELSPACQRGWWNRWGKSPPPLSLPPSIHIHTQVGGVDLHADVPLRPDGYFEVSFETELPPARRGWRMARHRLIVGEQTLLACNVVLPVPSAAGNGLLVVLPLQFTYDSDGVQRFTESALARRLTELLRALHDEHGAEQPIYYLGCVPIEERHRQPELALAATSLGWPSGPIVLVPSVRGDAADALAAAIDRLRWLFVKQLEFVVINQESAAEPRLREAVKEQAELAPVNHYAGASEDLRTLRINGEQRTPLPPHIPPQFGGGTWGVRPTRQRCVPCHPVVFCHGMLAMTMLRMQIPEDTNYFAHLRPFLRERGIEALYPNVEPTGGVAARAEQLRDLIRHWTSEPINLVAHSMGGLDARYLIAHLGMAERVASLTTIAAPHHGTSVADWFCLNFRQRVPLLLTLEAFGINVDGFRDCRTDVCRTFNERTPNAAGVRYFSYTASVPSSRVSPLLRRAWNILTPAEGTNDGLVSVRSAAWGEVIGTLSVDHFGQTPDGLFVRPGENFDAVNFYARLIEDLAHRGL